MSLTSRLEDRVGITTAKRCVDGLFLGMFMVALAVCHATGLGLAGVIAVAVASFALELAASGVVSPAAITGAEGTASPPARLRKTVASTADAMGVARPAVVVDDGEGGVTVVGDGSEAVVVVGESTLALDDASLRAAVAHELAHVSLGHLRRVPVRPAVTHVVGFAAFWVVALQHLSPALALIGGVGYLVAGVGRRLVVNAAFYVVASAGVVLVPLALSACTARLEECAADDVAAARTSERAFCTALYRLTTGDAAGGGGVGGADDRRRGLLARFTALYPPVERRIARQGLAVADVENAAAADRDTAVRESLGEDGEPTVSTG